MYAVQIQRPYSAGIQGVMLDHAGVGALHGQDLSKHRSGRVVEFAPPTGAKHSFAGAIGKLRRRVLCGLVQ